MCCVFWLFWLSFSVLAKWLARKTLWTNLIVARGCLQKAQAEECLWFSLFIVLFHCLIVWLFCPQPCVIYVLLLWHDIACLCWNCRKTPQSTNYLLADAFVSRVVLRLVPTRTLSSGTRRSLGCSRSSRSSRNVTSAFSRVCSAAVLRGASWAADAWCWMRTVWVCADVDWGGGRMSGERL